MVGSASESWRVVGLRSFVGEMSRGYDLIARGNGHRWGGNNNYKVGRPQILANPIPARTRPPQRWLTPFIQNRIDSSMRWCPVILNPAGK